MIEAYGIGNQLGFFTTDNAENNDTCLAVLGRRFGFNETERRLRCAGHIFNLVVKAFLYGKHLSSFESSLAGASEQEELDLWRKRGPIGKLHNICVHINRTPQRRALFKSKQAEADYEAEKLYEAAVDGGIRWNSTEFMIERALKLRNAVDLYVFDQLQTDNKSTLRDDVLKPTDWADLSQFLEVLQPFKFATKRLEGNASIGSHGVLWEVIITIDFLLEKLEGYRARLQLQDTEDTVSDKEDKAAEDREHFKTSINQAWAVLNKYYKLSDDTPAYRAAVVLNPRFKMEYFRAKWQDHPSWITDAEASLKQLWKEYKERYNAPVITETVKEKSQFEVFMDFQSHNLAADELDRYLSLPCDPVSDALSWWRSHKEAFPTLSLLAFDLLSVPAMSSECERAFSKAGKVVTNDRNRISGRTIQAGECLKSWSTQNLIKITSLSD